MDNLFDFSTIEEPPKIKQSEFNELAKKVLKNICNSYHQSWHSRPLKDEEFPEESVCNKCTGCGTFKENGKEKDCVQDREQGWCYHRYIDAEEFGIEVETELENIYHLLGSEITSSVNEGKQDGANVSGLLPPDKIWLLKEITHPYIYETAEEGTYSIATQGIEKILECYERLKQQSNL